MNTDLILETGGQIAAQSVITFGIMWAAYFKYKGNAKENAESNRRVLEEKFTEKTDKIEGRIAELAASFEVKVEQIKDQVNKVKYDVGINMADMRGEIIHVKENISELKKTVNAKY